MTDNTSERAEQLLTDLFKKCYSGSEAKSFRHAMRREFTPMLISWAESLLADSANLARGMALEQAAKICGSHTYANLILSLDPNAAQALAAHDARWRSALFEAAIPLEVIAGQLNEGYMQEISVELAQQIHVGLKLIRAALAESQPAPAKEGEK